MPRCVLVGLESFVKVNVTVKDINDNKPELAVDEVFLCEGDVAGTVIEACFNDQTCLRSDVCLDLC